MFNVKEVVFDNVEFLVFFAKDLFTFEVIGFVFLQIKEGFLTKIMQTVSLVFNVLVKVCVLAIREFFIGVIAIGNMTKDVVRTVDVALLTFHVITCFVDDLRLTVKVCFCFLKRFIATVSVSGQSKETKG